MKRLELVRVRVCQCCGRGRAELRTDAGDELGVALDPLRAHELAGHADADALRSLADVLLGQLAAAGAAASEVVLDVADGRLRALLTVVHGGDVEFVSCTPQEGIGLAVRGSLALYATAETLARGAAEGPKADGSHGPGGSETLH